MAPDVATYLWVCSAELGVAVSAVTTAVVGHVWVRVALAALAGPTTSTDEASKAAAASAAEIRFRFIVSCLSLTHVYERLHAHYWKSIRRTVTAWLHQGSWLVPCSMAGESRLQLSTQFKAEVVQSVAQNGDRSPKSPASCRSNAGTGRKLVHAVSAESSGANPGIDAN